MAVAKQPAGQGKEGCVHEGGALVADPQSRRKLCSHAWTCSAT